MYIVCIHCTCAGVPGGGGVAGVSQASRGPTQSVLLLLPHLRTTQGDECGTPAPDHRCLPVPTGQPGGEDTDNV